jgi:hypothetical protein
MSKSPLHTERLTIDAGSAALEARRLFPDAAQSAVLLARLDGLPDAADARRLAGYGLASLSVELLTAEERDQDRAALDAELLADRLEAARGWLADRSGRHWRALGLVGEGAAARAALVVAGRRPDGVDCVVALNYSGALAQDLLGAVRCPTLLLVPRPLPIDAAQAALGKLSCEKELAVAAEPDAQALWLSRHLRPRRKPAAWY